MRQQRVDQDVFNFCVACGNQLRAADGICPCCGYPTVETNRVTLPRQNREPRFGRRDEHGDEDPFYLL